MFIGLIVFVQVVGMAFSQASGADTVKVDFRLGADYHFLPSDNLQYLPNQITYGNHANNKDYKDFSTGGSVGLSYGRCRLEAGADVSFADMDYYGSEVSYRILSVPISFSYAVYHTEGFGISIGASFCPYKPFGYLYRTSTYTCGAVTDWGSRAGLFVEADKSITRKMDLFIRAGFDAVLNPSYIEDDMGNDFRSPAPPMYQGNSFYVGLGVKWNILYLSDELICQ